MGLWQIFNVDGVAQDEQFDDGLAFMPGEDGYSTDAVAARAVSFGADFTFSLIGVPNWHVRIEAEHIADEQRIAAEKADADQAAKEAQEAADAERDRATAAQREAEQAERDAASIAAQEAASRAAQQQARAAAEAELAAMLDPSSVVRAQINAKFDAMLASLPDRAKDIKALRAAALKEVAG